MVDKIFLNRNNPIRFRRNISSFSRIKNSQKKGQLMSLYLPILTLFMCAIIIALFYIQHKDVASSLVSPKAILEMSDGVEIFKIQEQEKFLDSVSLSGYGWGSENYAAKIKETYCGLFASNNFSDFMFEDIFYFGRESSEWEGAFDSPEEKKEFCNKIYSFKFEDNKLYISRSNVEKKKRLTASEIALMNFPIVVSYSFDAEYLITNENKFEIKEI